MQKKRIEMGKVNRFTILEKTYEGFWVDGKNYGRIFLPLKRFALSQPVGNEIDLFLYKDSQNDLLLTPQIPFIQVGQFASLKVVSTTTVGAFLDWGLDKDLFLPYAEQRGSVEEGDWVTVFCYIDKASRISASTRLERFLKKLDLGDALFSHYEQKAEENQAVELLIYSQSPLGFNCVVNNEVGGLLFHSESFRPLSIGEKLNGYIKQIRPNGKIDLMLERAGYEKVEWIAQKIKDLLRQNDGFLPISDRSSPEVIYERIGISKKNFKKAIGLLYKSRLIVLEEEGIHLLKK